MNNASNIKPWMTELWMWADKFKISEVDEWLNQVH